GRHQGVVGGAVDWALGPEAAPPLQSDGPRVPDERRARVDADQQRWRLGQVFPARNLHPEPVVDQRVPQIFLALHERVVGTVERPLGRAVGYPSRGAIGTFAASRGLAARVTREPRRLWLDPDPFGAVGGRR